MPPVTESLVPELHDLRDRIGKTIADGLRLTAGISQRPKSMPSPIVSWLRLTLGQSFALIAAHQKRHLWQP